MESLQFLTADIKTTIEKNWDNLSENINNTDENFMYQCNKLVENLVIFQTKNK